MNPKHEHKIISVIRGLSLDGPLAAKSGHQGTALALAPLAAVLFGRVMKHDPADPHWVDRDRFVLSNGHASILLYSTLHVSGYDVSIKDLKAFRQWGSRTPGHPEVHHTDGIEVTTGPLGQGLANAVGFALAEQQLRTRFGDKVMNHHTWVVAGDGCLMEGISHEAASLAGHLGLGHLNVIFDDNGITIDGHTTLSCSDDAAARFSAYGWHVERAGAVADDPAAIEAALLRAKAVTDRPSLLILESRIGFPSPTWTDRHEAHGNPFTAADVAATKALLGLPSDAMFFAPADLVDPFRLAVAKRGATARAAWQKRFDSWKGDKAAWNVAWGDAPKGWAKALPRTAAGTMVATRSALQNAIQATADALPGLMCGSADLTGNNGVKVAGATALSRAEPGGTQVYFGIREHAMGAAINGMALHGGVRPIGATFFVFSDYLRPSLRLAAVSQAQAIYVFSHDSVGVGEDGPTHQPVEQLMSIRLIPGLQVIRPADANETSEAWRVAIEHDGPTAIILSRQAIRVVTDGSAVEAGAGVVVPTAKPDLIVVASGSEVALCVEAVDALAAKGIRARVVSMPSWDRFESQPAAVRRKVFPAGIPVLSVEAGTTLGWERYADASIGVDRFGASAPGDVVLQKLGINVDNIVRTSTKLLASR